MNRRGVNVVVMGAAVTMAEAHLDYLTGQISMSDYAGQLYEWARIQGLGDQEYTEDLHEELLRRAHVVMVEGLRGGVQQ